MNSYDDIVTSNGEESITKVIRVPKDREPSEFDISFSADHNDQYTDAPGGVSSYTNSSNVTRRHQNMQMRQHGTSEPDSNTHHPGVGGEFGDDGTFLPDVNPTEPRYSTVSSILVGQGGKAERKSLSCMNLVAPYPVDSAMEGQVFQDEYNARTADAERNREFFSSSHQQTNVTLREKKYHRSSHHHGASKSEHTGDNTKARRGKYSEEGDLKKSYSRDAGRARSYSQLFTPQANREYITSGNTVYKRKSKRAHSHHHNDCHCCCHGKHCHGGCGSAAYPGSSTSVYYRPAATIVYDEQTSAPAPNVLYQHDSVLQRPTSYAVSYPHTQPIHVLTQPSPTIIYSQPPYPTGSVTAPVNHNSSRYEQQTMGSSAFTHIADPDLMSIEFVSHGHDEILENILTEADTEEIRMFAQKASINGDTDQSIAEFLKQDLDHTFGKDWNVVVSAESFGSNVESIPGCVVQFKESGLAILLWKV